MDGLSTARTVVPAAGRRPGRGDVTRPSYLRAHPVVRLLVQRLAAGLLTLLVVSFIVFWATQVLPGNAVTAILGQQATPEQVARFIFYI